MTAHIVGIAGGSGSGKTTLIRFLQSTLGSDLVSVISQDDYYLNKEDQVCDANGEVNFDLPSAIDHQQLVNDLKQVMSGDTVSIQRYTFNNINDLTETIRIEPRPVIIVEGLFVFHYPELKQHFDYRIFVDAAPETRYSRRLMRDTTERGYPEETIRYQWEHHVEPAFRSYLLPHRSDADVIIDNEHEMREEIHHIIDAIKAVVNVKSH